MGHMSFRVSDKADEFLERFAKEKRISKAAALSRAIALLAVATEQQKNGKLLGIVEEDEEKELHAVGRISGI